LNADGSVDPSFNPGGTGFGSLSMLGHVLSHQLARGGKPTGKLLVSYSGVGTYGGKTIPSGFFRLNADGTPDLTFNALGVGTEGQSTVGAFTPELDPRGMAPGGTIVAGGNRLYNRILHPYWFVVGPQGEFASAVAPNAVE